MLQLINKDLWFDNEKLFIIRGNENKNTYEKNYDSYPDAQKHSGEDESETNYKPTIIYMSSLTCNLKCKYCYAGGGEYGENHNMRFFTFENYVKTYDYMFKKYNGISNINFFGGEPLLNFEEIKKFVEYIYQNYSAKDIPTMSFATNLTIMNEEIKDFIKKYHILIGSSLDGPKDLNDLVRVGSVNSVYDEVVKNLNYLSDVDVKKAVQITISKNHIENYKKGDVINWIKEIEKLPIDVYEVICVFSDNKDLKIDLNDDKMRDNYIQFCEDYVDYSLSILKDKEPHKSFPSSISAVLLRIMKREPASVCGAGYSFSITPDLKIYPCHIFADKVEFGVNFSEDEDLEQSIENNKFFMDTRKCDTTTISECNNCVAKNLCSVFCKGCIYKHSGNFSGIVEDRCILQKIFVTKAIKFLVTDYKKYEDIVNDNLYYYQSQLDK